MADYLLDLGAPVDKILIEDSSKDTITNIAQLGKILIEKNIYTLGLVSSPYHLLRIQHMRLPSDANIKFHPYNPEKCAPPLPRQEIWFSAHYNAMAYTARVIFPKSLYRKAVNWIRENTEW